MEPKLNFDGRRNIVKDLNEDKVWNELVKCDFTPALKFNWIDSQCKVRLIKSLSLQPPFSVIFYLLILPHVWVFKYVFFCNCTYQYLIFVLQLKQTNAKKWRNLLYLEKMGTCSTINVLKLKVKWLLYFCDTECHVVLSLVTLCKVLKKDLQFIYFVSNYSGHVNWGFYSIFGKWLLEFERTIFLFKIN